MFNSSGRTNVYAALLKDLRRKIPSTQHWRWMGGFQKRDRQGIPDVWETTTLLITGIQQKLSTMRPRRICRENSKCAWLNFLAIFALAERLPTSATLPVAGAKSHLFQKIRKGQHPLEMFTFAFQSPIISECLQKILLKLCFSYKPQHDKHW